MAIPWTIDVGDLRLTAGIHSAAQERGVVIVVHGFGEHRGRYDRQREFFAERGLTTVSYDLRGSGSSPGPRAKTSVHRHVRDLQAVRDAVRARWRKKTGSVPFTVLFGHSMGGLVAAESAVRNPFDFDLLVLSSPALVVGEKTPAVLRRLGPYLARVVPGIPVGSIPPEYISRRPGVVEAYRTDPLVHHGKVPAVSGATMVADGRAMLTRCRAIGVPTLIFQGSGDRVVSVAGAREFARVAGADADPRPDVTYREFEGGYHELFNDDCADEVYELVGGWLDMHIT